MSINRTAPLIQVLVNEQLSYNDLIDMLKNELKKDAADLIDTNEAIRVYAQYSRGKNARRNFHDAKRQGKIRPVSGDGKRAMYSRKDIVKIFKGG